MKINKTKTHVPNMLYLGRYVRFWISLSGSTSVTSVQCGFISWCSCIDIVKNYNFNRPLWSTVH